MLKCIQSTPLLKRTNTFVFHEIEAGQYKELLNTVNSFDPGVFFLKAGTQTKKIYFFFFPNYFIFGSLQKKNKKLQNKTKQNKTYLQNIE